MDIKTSLEVMKGPPGPYTEERWNDEADDLNCRVYRTTMDWFRAVSVLARRDVVLELVHDPIIRIAFYETHWRLYHTLTMTVLRETRHDVPPTLLDLLQNVTARESIPQYLRNLDYGL